MENGMFTMGDMARYSAGGSRSFYNEDLLVLDLVEKKLVTDQITLTIRDC